jgi:hypothetical protein
MSFLMGSALWWGIGALVVSIPIIIHLLHRQRTQPVLWGAMIFLRMSMLQQKRRKRVEHWLLMLLRLALLALLVLLLGNVVLKPGFIAAVTTGGSRSSADIAIIVDHSLSTQWRSGDKAVFQHEVAAVSEWTKSDVFKQGDTITIILAEKTPRVLCEAGESSELPGWVQKLSALPPGSTRASIPAAIQSAREVLNRRGKNASKMILVVSDEQRDNWEVGGNPDQWAAAVGATARGIDPTAKVYSIPVKAASQQSNLAVEGLKIDPEREVIPRPVGANRAVKIQASIRNTGKTEMPGATASLWVDGIQAKDSKGPIQVNVRALPAAKPGESTGGYIETVSFSYAFPKPKSCVVEVRVDVAGDGFPADNAAVGSVTVMEPLPVLIIDRQSGDPADESNPAALQKYHASELLVSAMLSDAPTADAPPLMSPTIISASDNAHLRELTKEGLLITTRNAEGKPVSIRRTLDDFAAVILNDVGDLDQTFASRLNDYMASGHGVWCILGESTSASYLRDQISGTRLFPLEVPERLTEIGAPKQVQVKDNQYPVLLNFNTAQNRYLEGMTSQKLWAVTPASDGTVPLTTPDGLPLILDRPAVSGNGGRVILWTTPISGSAETRGWNNWTTMKMFSPIVNRTTRSRGFRRRCTNRSTPLPARRGTCFSPAASAPTN